MSFKFMTTYVDKETGKIIKTINSKKAFLQKQTISSENVWKAFDFAYDMTFGRIGEHRNYRSGGTHRRKRGEIFANTFQGKLSEFAVYEALSTKYFVSEPDLNKYLLGKWDSYDFKIKDKLISIKSTKHFGQLLLLETKDWNKYGQYIPNNNESYDFTFVVRLKNDPESIMKSNRLLYSDFIDYQRLHKIFENVVYEYDIPGFISHEDIIYLIKNQFIIHKGELLNGTTEMDADNYYCQMGDMKNFEEFVLED